MNESPDLIQQALGNLVKQFAHPMDCLRELVQNAIDAGTPRIEIELRYSPGDGGRGVLEIEVADFGQGMDAAIIDTQLTRLFSSAKEGDLSTIGKFGIGFTSVFAIDPVLVRVLTGRHGENWEILFHQDRSFERRPWDGPVQGTAITLYKRVRDGAVAAMVTDARDTLVRWCEHAETPLLFRDLTRDRSLPDGAVPEGGGEDDVFAAFDTAPVEETLNRPFSLDHAELEVRHVEGDVEAVVGFERSPSWGFFSGGLTLLRSRDPGHLGERYAHLVGHLSFKVRSRRIEHTLTRDNVIQDEAWYEAMDVVTRAARKLRAELEVRVSQIAREGGDLGVWHEFLALDAQHEPLPWDVPLFVDLGGRARTLAEVAPLGPFGREAWFVHPADEALGHTLWRRGVKVLRYDARTVGLLRTALAGHRIDDVAEAFAVTRPVAISELPPAQRAVFESAASHLGVATGNGVKLGVCDVEGAQSSENTLFVEGRVKDGLLRRPARRGAWGSARRAWQHLTPLMMLQRWVVVNRRHPHVVRLLELGASDADLAGFALAQVVMVEEQMYDEDNFDALAVRAAREWLQDV
ncbi:MAG: ATP-binding protein [Myxococcota bacterium]